MKTLRTTRIKNVPYYSLRDFEAIVAEVSKTKKNIGFDIRRYLARCNSNPMATMGAHQPIAIAAYDEFLHWTVFAVAKKMLTAKQNEALRGLGLLAAIDYAEGCWTCKAVTLKTVRLFATEKDGCEKVKRPGESCPANNSCTYPECIDE